MSSFPPALGAEHRAAQPSARQFEMGPWQQYTPVWTNGTSNPTLGNGTLTGRYRRHGTTLHLLMRIVVGSTTTVGSGTIRLGIPTGFDPGPVQQILPAFWYAAGSGTLTKGLAIIDTGSTYAYIHLTDGAPAGNSNASGLGNGDIVTTNGTIEIAA